MTATDTPEYRELELASSNDIIRHDARRGDRKYAEAAWHALQAGHARRRMGILMRDAGQFTRAAEDWLSAGACFYLATDPKLIWAGLEKVRELDRAGHIPPERRDLHKAIHEREEQLKSLERRLAEFIQEYARLFSQAGSASPERLEFLRKHVREFPGFAPLHYAIHQQARELGGAPLAAEHLRWAAEFAPDEPEYVGRYGYQLIAGGQGELAANIANHFLAKHPNETSVRVMLAQALASRTGNQKPDRTASIKILRDILADESESAHLRLAAVTLSGAIRRDMGEEAESQRLLALFDEIAVKLPGPTNPNLIAALREIFTSSLAKELGSDSEGGEQPLAERLQRVLYPSDKNKSMAA